MSKKFSQRAEKILGVHAQRYAKKYGYEQVEPIHVLLGISDEIGAFSEAILLRQNTSLDRVRKAAKQYIDRSAPIKSEAPLPESQGLKDLKNLAHQEAGGKTIQTEHLLIGILRLVDDDPAYKALHSQDVHIVRSRRMISQKLSRAYAAR